MADESFAGVGTRQYVALRLLEAVAQGQGKINNYSTTGNAYWNKTDKDWILDTYIECLAAAKDIRKK